MARSSKNEVRSRRFTSERSANNFAKSVNGKVKDLREFDSSKSNFKVTYTKGDAQNRSCNDFEVKDEYWK